MHCKFLLSVYEGVKSFYKEVDETVPVNVYGKSKVAAEKFISEKCSNFAILRSSIIFGPQTISPVPKSLPVQVCSRIYCVLLQLSEKFLLILLYISKGSSRTLLIKP